MNANDIVMNLFADTNKATRSIEDFSRKSSASLKSIESGFNALKAVAAGAVAIFAGRQLIGAITSITDAAAKQETAVNDLNTALKTSGEYSEAASKDMQDYASSIQQNTTYGDELVLSQLALAKAFGATNAQAKDVVTAATELAAATGKSLDEATRQVSKTLGGFAGELGEVNPKIKALTVEQLKAGEAAKILIEQYGGTAASKLKTFAGVIESTSNVYGDLLETLGQIITQNPAVIQAIESVREFLSGLIVIVQNNSAVISEFVTLLATRFITIIKYLGEIMPTIVAYIAAFSKALMAVDWMTIAQGAATFAAVWYGPKGLINAFNNGVSLVATLSSKFSIYAVAILAVAAGIDLIRANWMKLTTVFERMNLDILISQQEKLLANMKGGITFFGFEVQPPMPDKVQKVQNTMDDLIKKKKELEKQFESKGWSGGFIGELVKIKDAVFNPLGDGPINMPEVESVKIKGLEFPEGDLEATFKGPIEAAVMSASEKLAVSLAALYGMIFTEPLKGEAGARNIISTGAGAVAEAYLPSSGPVVKDVVNSLMSGADNMKKMIREFFDALPRLGVDIVEGMVASMDELTDSFVTSLIDDGGIERVMEAIIKSAPKVGWKMSFGFWMELDRRIKTSIFAKLGLRTGRDIGKEVLNWFNKIKLVRDLSKVLSDFTSIISGMFNSFQRIFDAMKVDINELPRKTVVAVEKAFYDIVNAFKVVIDQFNEVGFAVSEALMGVWDYMSEVFNTVYETLGGLFEAFPNFINSMWEAIAQLFSTPKWMSSLKVDTPEWLMSLWSSIQETPAWVTWVIDAFWGVYDALYETFDWFIDNLFGWMDGLGGGGDGWSGGQWKDRVGIGRNGGVFYAANGANFTPRGRDNIPVMVTQGERILSAEQNQAFEDMPILLSQIVQLLSREQVVTTKAEFNGRTFADLILNLSRRNERLTA